MLGVRNSVQLTRTGLVRSLTTTKPLLTNGANVKTTEHFPEGWESAKKYSEIPGPSRWQLIRSMLPGGVYHNVQPIVMHQHAFDTYGPICRFPGMLGKSDIIITFDPVSFEMVYRTEGIWPRRQSLVAFEHYRVKKRPDVFKGMGGLLNDQGENWHKLRTVVNPMMMSPKVAKSYVPTVDAVTRDFLQKVHVLRNADNELPATFGTELNMWALESIGVIALDRRLGVMDFERDADAELMIQTVKDFFRLSLIVEMAPPLWKYYETKQFKELMVVYDNMTRLSLEYVNKSIAELEAKAGSIRTTEKSVLEKLLEVNRHYAILMTFDMIFAGIDTTSSTSANLLYHLALNPTAQEKLREEVLRVLPNREADLHSNDLDKMSYMRACMKESMRIQPILPGSMRETGQNLVLNGYQIPQNTEVAMPTTLMLSSEQYFKDADSFQPERWLRDSNGQSAPTKALNPFAYLPFGFGTRSCVGRRLAEMEIQILMTRILRDYRIEWHHGPMQYGTSLITAPSSDLKFTFIPI